MRKPCLLFFFLFLLSRILAQVSPTVPATTHQHNKQVIGYITQWDAWKNVAGIVPQGGYNQLNVDYSQYTILNFSFFGVASDGSLHSGDYRNQNIYQVGAVQNPAPIVDSDIYSSWDMFLLNGELTTEYYISDGDDAYQLGYRNQGSGWTNINTGASGVFPLSVHKSGGAMGLKDLAHQKGVKVMASIGGWSMCKHYPEMAADANKRARFMSGVQKLMSMGFDGIDLDWEYPNDPGMNIEHYSTADFTNFAVLVEQIRATIGTTKLITACFSAAPAKLQGFDWARLDRSMNYFNLMTYDYNGGWSNKAGHNAPLYDYPGAEYSSFSLDATVKSIKALGVNMSKVNVGAPFYGRGVITSGTAALNGATTKRSETIQPDGPIQTCADYTNWSATVWQGTPNYSAVLQATGSGSGWTDHWDDVAKVPYMTKGNYFLSYDNPRSISAKAQYIKDNGLAGAIVWNVYGDMVNMTTSTVAKGKLIYCPSTQSPLVNTINQVFANGSTDTVVTPPPPVNTSKAVVGYWQNWGATTDNPPYIRLRDIDNRWNVIDIAFATTGGDFATLNFAPANGTVSDFISDIQLLQSQGKKVLLSIGGENGTVLLTGATQKQAFINSLEAIIDQYNFDGFDLDLEGGTTLQLNNGDNNFMSPTTPKVVNLIDACKQVIAHRQAAGKTCWLTMAPETFYVQTAYGSTYSPLVGAYLPIIYGLKDQLTFLAPQYYNTGSVTALDGKNYNQATPDFTVAMSEMLMTGFPVQGTSQTFPALRQDQVVFGLPATPGAAGGGYYAPAGVKQALDYLTKGISFGGAYQLRNASGYPGLRGAMTWSINWDKSGGNAWVANIYTYFFGNTGNTAPTVSLTSPATGASFTAPATVTLTATASDADGTVTKVDFFNGGTLLGTATAAPYSFTWNNVAAGSYTLTAIATDNSGATATSAGVSITVTGTTGGGGNCSGIATWDVTKVYTGGTQAVYNGSLYTAKWWTQGDQPDVNTGDGKPWQLVNACSGPTGNKAPTVNITAPASGTSVAAPATITIQATATDSDGTIAKVDFFNGSTLLGTATAAPYSFAWSNVAAGSYTLTAVATDNGGAATTSATVSITVTGTTGGGGNCSGVAAWDVTKVYTGGTQAVYNGSLYTAKWWTQGDQPDVNTGDGKPWQLVNACSASISATAQNTQGAKLAVPSDSRPLTVYPNPVSGSTLQLQMNALAGERLSVEIVSVSGSAPILHSELVTAGQGTQVISLNIGKLPSGIWIVRVKHPVSGRVETTKIIKL